MAALLVVAGCATSGTPATLAPGFAVAEIEVGGSPLTVWVAETSAERSQGLRGVEVLPDGIDGMLFVWDEPTTPSFGMRDTLMPLDLWWFDPAGVLIGETEMDVCPAGECVSYGAPGPVMWALETIRDSHRFEPGAELLTSESG